MSLGENVDTEGQTDEPMEGQTDRHRAITITHPKHIVLKWAKNENDYFHFLLTD